MHGTIVVGVEDSASARAALRWALDEARLRGARVRAVHAWRPPLEHWPEAYAAVSGLTDAELTEPLRRLHEDQLARVVREEVEHAPDVEIEQELVVGTATAALCERSEDADLLVVGSRGRGGFSELLLGSVSHQCAQHAPCPVVIVRGPAQRPR